MAGKTEFSAEAQKIIDLSKHHYIQKYVTKWLSNPANLEIIQSIVKTKEELYARQGFRASKNDAVDRDRAKKSVETIENILKNAAKYGIAKHVFNWLSDFRNTKQAAKDWNGFSEVVKYAGEYKIADTVFNWLNPPNTEQAAKKWGGVAFVVFSAGKFNIADTLFGWLTNPKNTEQAAKDWNGFSEVVRHAGTHKIADKLFGSKNASGWLDKEKTEEASKGWASLAKRLDDEEFRKNI